MDHREHLYSGDRKLRPLVKGDTKADGSPENTPHVRNIIFENIESQVSSSIPSPKVTPRRKEDEALAAKIEHWLRCELDRLPFETINDQAERTVPIQGGVGFLVAWDNRKRTHDTVGEEEVAMLHPKQFAPQPGIYTGIQDMDWFIVRQPTTKEGIRRRYGVNVENEGEQEPHVRGTGNEDTADGAVTMYIGYAKNDRGAAGAGLCPLRPGTPPPRADHPEPAGRGGDSGAGRRGGGDQEADRRPGPGPAAGAGGGGRYRRRPGSHGGGGGSRAAGG